mmetsp:Transcript_16112/g.26219  ORF Transcript_16112/g.26219 Transcript_16112/m.26219 type:complete len:101 (+) Transcript_16112:154-456(+)
MQGKWAQLSRSQRACMKRSIMQSSNVCLAHKTEKIIIAAKGTCKSRSHLCIKAGLEGLTREEHCMKMSLVVSCTRKREDRMQTIFAREHVSTSTKSCRIH